MDIVRERLEREVNLDLISTVPNVVYHVYLTDGTMELDRLQSVAKSRMISPSGNARSSCTRVVSRYPM